MESTPPSLGTYSNKMGIPMKYIRCLPLRSEDLPFFLGALGVLRRIFQRESHIVSYLAYLHNSLVVIPFHVSTLEPVEWSLINSVGKKLLTLLPTFTWQKRRRRSESTEASLEAIHHQVHQVEADHLQEVISTIFLLALFFKRIIKK